MASKSGELTLDAMEKSSPNLKRGPFFWLISRIHAILNIEILLLTNENVYKLQNINNVIATYFIVTRYISSDG